MEITTIKRTSISCFAYCFIVCLTLFLASSSPVVSSPAPTQTTDLTTRTQEEVLAFCKNVTDELHFGTAQTGAPAENGVPPYRVPLAGSVFEAPDERYNTFPLTSWIDTIYPPFDKDNYEIDEYNGVNNFAEAKTEPPENREQLNLYQGARVRPSFEYGPSKFRYRHRDTELIKPVDLNPWYSTGLQGIESEQPASPYLGSIYRGSRNFHRHRNRLTNVTSSAPRGENASIERNAADGCERVIETARTALASQSLVRPHDTARGYTAPNYLDPVWNRMEFDNCANQFILGRARQVRTIFQGQGEKQFLSVADQTNAEDVGEEGAERAEILSQKFCQPFRLVPLPHEEQEYFPSDYLMFSWRKLLFNTDFLLRNGAAAKEPNYALNGVRIPPDQAIPEPFKGVDYTVATENPTPVATFSLGQVSSGGGSFFRSFRDLFKYIKSLSRQYRPVADSTFNFTAITETSEFNNGAICVNDVTERQYERILDPSHPFTPRWDFTINERDYYSPMTAVYGGNPYDQVRCAGAPNADGGTYAEGRVADEVGVGPAVADYSNRSEDDPEGEEKESYESEEKAKEPAEDHMKAIRERREIQRDNAFISDLTSEFIPKVDILTWRQAAFDKVITQRILFNIICYYASINGESCWDKLECGDNIAGGQENGQCCATNWNGKEAKGILDGNYISGNPCGDVLIKDACLAIAKPLAPMNPLKLVSEKEPSNVPEGYHFRSYFGAHRPYMRCWDMGKECGNKENTGELTDTELGESLAGADYALAGVGRHIAGEGPYNTGDKCRIGGGDNRQSILNPGVRFGEEGKPVEPITSWAELKLYQARSIRDFSLNCFVKHESLFKQGSGEEIILSRSGGEFQTIAKDSTGKRTQVETEAWPMSWRGYVTDSDPTHRFPHYAAISGTATMHGTGLDSVLAGDMLVYNKDLVMPAGGEQNWRMPYVAFVTESHTAFHGKPGLEWIRALAFNNGRALDTCGNNDFWGQGEEYTMWKDEIPRPLKEELKTLGFPAENHTKLENYYGAQVEETIKATGGAYTPSVAPPLPTCDDPGMSNCVENYWGEVPVYFAPNDLRHK